MYSLTSSVLMSARDISECSEDGVLISANDISDISKESLSVLISANESIESSESKIGKKFLKREP